MFFAYKINVDRDGFTPQRLLGRLDARGRIHLGWRQYVDAVEQGDTVFVYFTGRRLTPGIYCRAAVVEVDEDRRRVWLKIEEVDVDAPIADGATTRRVTALVSRSKRQVFALPEDAPTDCSAFEPGASSCASRGCDRCPLWRRLPRVLPGEGGRPDRLRAGVQSLAAGMWTVPPRSFLGGQAEQVVPEAKLATDLLRTFKVGEGGLAYAFAAAAHESLRGQTSARFDAVVPIPLSPEKIEAEELHRALVLAVQLSFLIKAPVCEALSLAVPVGKRAMLKEQKSVQQFEATYRASLRVDEQRLSRYKSVLLVDDVCTRGSTLSVAAEALRRAYPRLEVHAAVGALMAVKASASQASNLRVDGKTEEGSKKPVPRAKHAAARTRSEVEAHSRELAGWKVDDEWHAEVRCSCGRVFAAGSIRQAAAMHRDHLA